MLGNSILSYVSFQTTNNQTSLDILSFEAHQIDSRRLAQYLMDFLRISLLIMKRTMVTTKSSQPKIWQLGLVSRIETGTCLF